MPGNSKPPWFKTGVPQTGYRMVWARAVAHAKCNEHVKYEYRDHEVDFMGDEEISVAELTKEIKDQFNNEGKYAPKDIPGFEGTLEQLNDLKIDKFINSHKI